MYPITQFYILRQNPEILSSLLFYLLLLIYTVYKQDSTLRLVVRVKTDMSKIQPHWYKLCKLCPSFLVKFFSLLPVCIYLESNKTKLSKHYSILILCLSKYILLIILFLVLLLVNVCAYPLQYLASLVAVKNPPAKLETWVPSLGQEDTLEQEMAIHSSILTWKIPWTVWSLVGYSPWGHKRVGHDRVTEQQHLWVIVTSRRQSILLGELLQKITSRNVIVDLQNTRNLMITILCQTRLSDFTFTFHFHALEKEMATHSSVLAWRIPGTGEPDGLPSMGSHRVGHDRSDAVAAVAYFSCATHFKYRAFISRQLSNFLHV